MQVRVAASSDVGQVRENNEDAYLTDLPLIAVADGVAGGAAGEEASHLAIQVMASWRPRLERHAEWLERAAVAAHHKIFSTARTHPRLRGMSTTLTCAWVENGSALVAHIGDSRAYLLRGAQLTQLTEDHTQVELLVRSGTITREESLVHPFRNRLYQALGGALELAVDTLRVDLERGDRLLLSSDGLHDYVPDSQIESILIAQDDPDEACRTLVAAANGAGGGDNITVVVLDVIDTGSPDAHGTALARRLTRFRRLPHRQPGAER